MSEANTIVPVVTSTPVTPNKQEVKQEDPQKLTASLGELAKPKEDPQSQESFSKRFSALNRERKEIDKTKDMVKREKAALEAEKAQIAKEKAELAEYNARKTAIKEKKDPIAALQEFGYTYEEASQFVLNDNRPTPELLIKETNEKIAALEAKLAEKDKEALVSQQQLLEKQSIEQNHQAIDTIKNHLSGNPDFESLVELEMHEDIFTKINNHYNETGEVLQIDEVAKEFLEGVKARMEAITKTNFYKKNYAQATAPSKVPPKTLSNSLTSQTVPVEKKPYKTDEERVRNALAMLAK